MLLPVFASQNLKIKLYCLRHHTIWIQNKEAVAGTDFEVYSLRTLFIFEGAMKDNGRETINSTQI